jgi:RND family efflux transporter MFP subunit
VVDEVKVLKLAIRNRGGPGDATARRGRFRFFFKPSWLLLIMLVLGSGYYFGLREHATTVTAVTVALFHPAQAYTLLNATGYVIPQTKADIASKATGRLEKLEFEEGSPVKAGQVVARLESQDMVASLNEAAANVEVARTDLAKAQADLKEARFALNRANQLLTQKYISREFYDAVVARHAKAVAAVESARAQIMAAEAARRAAQVAVDYTLIRAPFDGVILKKHADVGDVVAPFASTAQSKGAVVSIADLGTLEVEADVSESNLYKVSSRQPCDIQLDAIPDERFRGEVHRIMPTVDKTKATVEVKVRFLDLDQRILPDMSAKVAFLSRNLTAEERKPVTAVAAAALVRREGAVTAFLIDGDRAKETKVDTGPALGDVVIVRSGLKLNDRVLINAPATLKDGALIRLAE